MWVWCIPRLHSIIQTDSKGEGKRIWWLRSADRKSGGKLAGWQLLAMSGPRQVGQKKRRNLAAKLFQQDRGIPDTKDTKVVQTSCRNQAFQGP